MNIQCTFVVSVVVRLLCQRLYVCCVSGCTFVVSVVAHLTLLHVTGKFSIENLRTEHSCECHTSFLEYFVLLERHIIFVMI